MDGLKIEGSFVPAATDLLLGNSSHHRPRTAPWILKVADLCLMLER
jgi:hypothetical protein